MCRCIYQILAGFSGIGQFSNLQGSVAYTSPLNMTLGANVTNANSVSNFTDTVSQLINSLSNVCASLDKSVVLDVLQRQFIEALMKLAIDSRVIDIQTAISISAGYSTSNIFLVVKFADFFVI